MANATKLRVGRRMSPSLPAEYPKLLYHCRTGQIARVLSASDEINLGPEWGPPQTDVRYPKTPPPIMTEPKRPPVFWIEIPGDDQ